MRRFGCCLGLVACALPADPSGVGEPIVVLDREASFHLGPLPADDTKTSPLIRYATGVGSIVTVGQGDIPYNGLATADAYSVAVALPDVGTGHWVVPVDGPDVTQNNELLFDLVVSFTRDLPFGLQTLDFVALDASAQGGPRYATQLCLLPEVAAGSYWACDAAITPPNAVVSLSWDTNVDLDLVVVTPSGKLVTSKTPTTVLATGPIDSTTAADPSVGTLSRDSNADCDIDGIRLESLVFPGEPPPGEYLVYARLHQACGEGAVHYNLDLLRRVDAADGSHPVETTPLGVGTLLGSQVSRDGALGTLVATVSLP
jgi:hypothetical protein